MEDKRKSARVFACWAIGGWLGTAGGVGVEIAVASPTPDGPIAGYVAPARPRDALPAPSAQHPDPTQRPDHDKMTPEQTAARNADTRAKAIASTNAAVDDAMKAVKAANHTATLANGLAVRHLHPAAALRRADVASVSSVEKAMRAVAAASAAATALYSFTVPHIDREAGSKAVATAEASVGAALTARDAASDAATVVFDLGARHLDAEAATTAVAAASDSIEAAGKMVATARESRALVEEVTAHDEGGGEVREDPNKPKTTAAITGLSRSTEPEWSLVGDASITSIDFSKPTASLGLERATPFGLVFVTVRKNATDNSIKANQRDRAFGQGVLAPSLASFSVLAHYEWRPWSYIRCSLNCERNDAIVNTKKSKGWYATGEASYAKLTATNGSMVSDYFAPVVDRPASSIAWKVGYPTA